MLLLLVTILSYQCVRTQTVNTKAASLEVNCGCQCSSLTFRDKYNRIQGNCKTSDNTGAQWCYTTRGSTCEDLKSSTRYGRRGVTWSYQACSTPSLHSNECAGYGSTTGNLQHCRQGQTCYTGVIKAASLEVNCGCQCSSLTFRDKYNRIQGNCKTSDNTGAQWCYTEPGSTCEDLQRSTRFGAQGRTWSYQACSTPSIHSSQCSGFGGFGGNNGGFSGNNGGFGEHNGGFGGNNGGIGSQNSGFSGNNLGFSGNNGGFSGFGSNNGGFGGHNEGFGGTNGGFGGTNHGFSGNNVGFNGNNGAFGGNNGGLSGNNGYSGSNSGAGSGSIANCRNGQSCHVGSDTGYSNAALTSILQAGNGDSEGSEIGQQSIEQFNPYSAGSNDGSNNGRSGLQGRKYGRDRVRFGGRG